MTGLAPLFEGDPPRHRARLSARPTAQEAACWVGICRVLDDHAPRCPREPDAVQRAAALLHWKLRQRRQAR